MLWWIRKRHILLFLILAVILFAMNFHVIRVGRLDFDIIRKEKMTLDDMYVDVRNWLLADYFYHAPRIRNYLFFEKPYNRLLALIQEKKAQMEKIREKNMELYDPEKDELNPLEKTIREWIDKILN